MPKLAKPKTKGVLVRLDQDTYEALQRDAYRQTRSLANLIRHLLEKHAKEVEK